VNQSQRVAPAHSSDRSRGAVGGLANRQRNRHLGAAALVIQPGQDRTERLTAQRRFEHTAVLDQLRGSGGIGAGALLRGAGRVPLPGPRGARLLLAESSGRESSRLRAVARAWPRLWCRRFSNRGELASGMKLRTMFTAIEMPRLTDLAIGGTGPKQPGAEPPQGPCRGWGRHPGLLA